MASTAHNTAKESSASAGASSTGQTHRLYQRELSEGDGTSIDQLMECLVFLTHYFDRPRSAEVLGLGLPLVDNRLTPRLFLRAAGRVGFEAKVVKRKLNALKTALLPAVIVTGEDRNLILLRRDDGDSVEVWDPESGRVEQIAYAELEKLYAGYCILVHPQFQPDEFLSDDRPPPAKAWFWGTIGRHWWGFAQVALATAMVNLFALTSPLFIMTVYDRVIPNNAVETLWVLAIGAATVFGFDFVIRYLRAYFIEYAGRNIDVILATRIFDQVLNIRLSQRPDMAGAFANVVKEYESLREFFTSASLAVIVDLPFIFLFIGVIWLIGGPLALVPLVVVAAVITVTLLIQLPLNRVVRRNYQDMTAKHGVLVETVSGLETLRAVGGDAPMRSKWEGYVGSTARTAQSSRLISTMGLSFTTTAMQLVTIGVVVYGAFLIRDGLLTLGAVVACVLLSGRAMAPLGQLSALLTRFHQSLEALRGLSRIMQLPVERPENHTFLHRTRLSGALSLQDVDFSYPGQSSPTLSEVSFTIDPGERVGLVGRLGSGKSTVLKLVLGLFDQTAGSIMVDGTERHQLDPADLRHSIGYVPQEALLFRGTIRENITMSLPHATDAAVLRAAHIAGVDDFAARHPSGYDMPIGEQGSGVSGGQRQAIAVARALVRQPPILLMDEPTSFMDSRAEELFKTRLLEGLSETTLLLVTHKASLLTIVDRLIVIDNGRVVADGPKESVVQALSEGLIRGDAKGK